ncbi:MAG: hypothetical protein CL936_04855 [Deltaproteobacteria bacterium]|nr:hypothetical protein [Deltaproteobacteria bacterium]OUW49583.1 MAG: hypothetical protein CBD47_01610 [Synechococcus sp. TMED187]
MLDVFEGVSGRGLVEVDAEIAVEKRAEERRLTGVSSRSGIALPGDLADSIREVLRGRVVIHQGRCDRGGDHCGEGESGGSWLHRLGLQRRSCFVRK